MYRASLVFFALALLVGCGGVTSRNNNPSNGGGGGGGGGGGAVGPAVVVNVSSGMTAGGVDVQVPSPATAPAPNATLFGATTVPSGGGTVDISLTNGSANVHQGSSIIVAMAGDGVSANMTVTISGPQDITIDKTTLKDITLKNGQKGLTFQASVAPSAAVGARTVLLENAQHDMTAFAGGLQVVP